MQLNYLCFNIIYGSFKNKFIDELHPTGYINNSPAHKLNLNEITIKFQEKDHKKIKITVDRNGEILQFEFRLEKKV